MKKSQATIYLFLIFLAGLALRLIAVFHSQSFWFDEVVSLKIAEKSIIGSWQYLQWENNPPLHYWLLHFWIKLFGSSEPILRLSSVLFSALNILLFYLLGKKISGRHSVGLFAAFLSAFSCYHLFTSMDARMYPLLLFFALLACYFFWRYLTEGKNSFLIFYASCALGALYTHLTAVFLLLSVNLYWLFAYYLLRRKNITWRAWLVANGAILLLWLPWFYNFAKHSLARFNNGAWYLHTAGGGGFFLFELPRSFFFLGDENPFLEFGALIILGIFFVWALARFFFNQSAAGEIKIKYDPAPGSLFALFIFLVPLAIGFCFQVWVSKYYLIGSAGLFLLLALGFDRLRLKSLFVRIIIIVLFLLFAPYNLWIIKNQGQHQWQTITSYIEANVRPGDSVFFPAFVYDIIVDHYRSKALPINHVLTRDLGDDQLLLAVKYNWYPVLNAEQLPDFNQVFETNQRIILVYPGISAQTHRADLVLDWFLKHHWETVTQKEFGGFEKTTVFIFKNPAF
ncbi:MAG TPA: glycosyltransferase family 39 protein [bacterium]|nr:glycosyltransferase family 39 protein [bacterium]